MNDYERSVMRNIIYAVETGGQVYGNRDYASFTEAYQNTSSETAITIGAGQWFAEEAQKLLNLIRTTNPTLFSSLDTAGVAYDLDHADWGNYQISRSSAKAQCIIRIIDSETGHQCQDSLIDQQMEEYVQEAANLGVTDMDAKMMCANFRHQGGPGAVTRILAKTGKPYTLDRLYAACQTDTGNQVGVYAPRQKMVYDALKKYITNYVVTPEVAIQTAINIARNEVGYLEKSSNSDLDSKTGNAGYGNYTKYWRDVAPEYQGQYWCACFITWVFLRAFGRSQAEELLKHYPYIYVPTLANLFTRYANPQVGDIMMYKNSEGVFSHTGLVIDVQGDLFVTIEGNTSPEAGVVDNGGGVYQKHHYNSQLPGTKFARPDYSLVKSLNSSGGSSYPSSSWTPTGTATCTGNGVNIRATPGGTVIGFLNQGNRFEVDGTKSGVWVHVKAAGLIGYIHENYVAYDSGTGSSSWTPTGTATCTGNGVNIRATPGGAVIGSLNQGNRFEVDGTKSGVWVHVKAAGLIGYIHENYVAYDSGTGGTFWNPTGTAVCTGNEVNVRATPGGTVIGTLNQGNRFEVDDTKSGEWVHIKVAGIGIGYIHQSYVAYDAPAVGESWSRIGTAVCTGNEVNVRATPGGTVIGCLNQGNRFEVDGAKSDVWVHIKVAGIGIGYIHQDYVAYDDSGIYHTRVAQAELNEYFHTGLSVDGIWGDKSKIAYIKAIQTSLNSVYNAGLTVDGEWGPATKAACKAHVLVQGTNNLFVRVLQIGLYANTISLENGIDGIFGVATSEAVILFQTNHSLEADGAAGPDTFYALAMSGYSGADVWNGTGTGFCTGNGVYVRLSPGGIIIGTLNAGNMFEVDGTRFGAWVHVKVNNIGIGYVHQDYVGFNA